MEPNTTESRTDQPQGPGLLEAVWRYRWLVAVVTVLAALAAYGLSQLQTTTYEARARMLLADPVAAGLFEELGISPERFIANQTEMANSPQVHSQAAELLQSGHTAEDVGLRVEVRPSEDVDVLTVVARAGTPVEAAALANAVAEAYQQVRSDNVQQRAQASIDQLGESIAQLRERIQAAEQDLQANPQNLSAEADREAAVDQLATFESRVNQIAVDAALFGGGVDQFTEAQPPQSPSSPQPRRNAAFGMVLGFLAAAGFAWYRAERTLSAGDRHDPGPVLEAPLLAQVPEFKSVGVSGLDPARSSPNSLAAESYQFLAASLDYALDGVNGGSVVVTSVGPGAGKTLTALNLAISATRAGRRVVLCDADERTRGLTALTRTASSPGLTDLADDQVPTNGVIAMLDVPGTPGLPFVAAGSHPADPAGFFRTPGFRTAMRRVKEGADLVIVDAPPLLAVSDTSAIAGQVDGIVMVVTKGTPLKALEETRDRLNFIGTPVLGYVFNRSVLRGSQYAAYGATASHGYGRDGFPTSSEAGHERSFSRYSHPSGAGVTNGRTGQREAGAGRGRR